MGGAFAFAVGGARRRAERRRLVHRHLDRLLLRQPRRPADRHPVHGPRAGLLARRACSSSSPSAATPGSSRASRAPTTWSASTRRRRSAASSAASTPRSARSSSPPSRSPGPVLLALILTDAAFGVVSRVVPQLNVFAVGFPAKIVVGLLLVGRHAALRRRLDQRASCSRTSAPPSKRSGSGLMAGEKTEKATPKKREEAREKGQVAALDGPPGRRRPASPASSRSAPPGPRSSSAWATLMRGAIARSSATRHRLQAGHRRLMMAAGKATLLAVAPIALACTARRRRRQRRQVGLRPSGKALKPDFRRHQPGVRAPRTSSAPTRSSRSAKSLAKVGVVAGIVAIALLPQHPEFGGMVGISPTDFGSILATDMGSLVKRAAFAYLFIGAGRLRLAEAPHREVDADGQAGDPRRGQEPEPPGRGARRSAAARWRPSRKRMMADVPTADVVVTNPTHYSVALRTTRPRDAPEVVAKGKDIIALRIRELAAEHGVPIVPDPPLARGALRVGRDRPADPRGVLRRRGRRSSPSSTARRPRRAAA